MAGAPGREPLEQPPLGEEVLLHAAVVVEVVAREVGEQRRPRTASRSARLSASACDDTSIAHAWQRASTISRSIRWMSGASGVVLDDSRSTRPMR